MSDDDSYVLPNEGSSGEDEDDDSEDETLDQLARHANRGREDENAEPVVNEADDIRPAAVAGVAAAARVVNVDRGVANGPPPAAEQNNLAAGRGAGRGRGGRG